MPKRDLGCPESARSPLAQSSGQRLSGGSSMSGALPGFVIETLIVLTVLFVFMVGVAVLVIIILFIIDVAQTKHAIRRNYPVIGRFDTCSSTWERSFASISLPWTARRCRSTESNETMSTGPPRTWIPLLLSGRPGIC